MNGTDKKRLTKNSDGRRGPRRKNGLFLLVVLVVLTAPSVPVAGEHQDRDERELPEVISESEYYHQVVNCMANKLAVPVAWNVKHASWVVLSMTATGNVYASWSITSEMGIGAEKSVMGLVARNSGGEIDLLSEAPKDNCAYVGNLHTGDFEYRLNVGGMGSRDSTKCSATTYWEDVTRILIAADVNGPSGEVEQTIRFGGSHTCSDGTIYDSEVIIYHASWQSTDIPQWAPI